MKRIIGLTLSIAIIVAVVGVFLAGAALAQDPTATPVPATPAAPANKDGNSPRFGPSVAYEALSKLLGMTPQEINDARKAGKTLSDLGKDKGVTDQQLVDALVGNHKAYLDQAVTDGKLTQKQADWLLQAAQTMAQLQLTNPFAMGRGGMGFMMGGFGPMMGGHGPMMGGRGPMMGGNGPMMGGGWGEKSGRGNGWNDDRGGRGFRRGGGMMPRGNRMQGRDGWGDWFDKGGNNSNQPGATPAPTTTPSGSSTA